MKNKKNNNKKPSVLRVIPLSGAETIGLNSYAVEYNDEIYVIDYGITFSDWDTLGIEYIFPDLTWLEENRHKIKAIIATHAHYDHVGGIPYVIDRLGYPPVYGSNFSMKFLEVKLKEMKKFDKTKLNVVKKNDIINFGDVKVGFVHVTHSIPQSFAVHVDTPEGRVFYTGDYKIDPKPIKEEPTDLERIRELSKEGILVSMLDSTNAFYPGRNKSESEIIEVLKDEIRSATGRVIIATFSSLVTRLGGLIESAKQMNKKIFVSGRSLETNIKIAQQIGYIYPETGIFVKKKDLNNIPDNQLLVLTTGSQAEEFASLTRMANDTHRDIKLKSTDKVIMSSSIIPTRVAEVQKLMDAIAKKGVQLVNSKLMAVHSSGHPFQDEMLDMAKAINSKFMIPVHGFTSFNAQHKRFLAENGFDDSKIFVPVEGSVFAFKDGKMYQEKKIEASPQYGIGNILLDDGAQIIRDKLALAKEGICAISVVYKKDKVDSISVMLRGISYMEEQNVFTEEVINRVKSLEGKNIKERDLKKEVYGKVGAYFHRKLRRYPVIAVDVIS